MATNIGIGATIGLGIGACFIPLLGPASAVPLILSFATAGAGIGTRAANADRIKDITDQTMNIIKERSGECIKIFAEKLGNGAFILLEKSCRAADTWNRIAIAGAVSAGAVGLDYITTRTAPELCIHDPLHFSCGPYFATKIASTVTTFVTLAALTGKACQLLLQPNQAMATKPAELPLTPTPVLNNTKKTSITLPDKAPVTDTQQPPKKSPELNTPPVRYGWGLHGDRMY